jgi:hypothetical protein
VEGSCEHGSKLSGSTKSLEILEQIPKGSDDGV